MKNFFKNRKLFLIIICLVALGAFLIFHFVTKDESQNDRKNLIYINLDDFKNKLNNKDDFMLTIVQTGCPHCEQFLPILNDALEDYDFNAYVINLSDLNSDLIEFKSLVNVSGTPTSVFYKNGVETTSLNRLVGEASKNTILERLKSLGYIE